MRRSILFACMLLAGCAHYIPPGGAANLPGSTVSGGRGLAGQTHPWRAPRTPATMAVVRLQAPGYQNAHTLKVGGIFALGAYSFVAIREIEDESDLERLSQLPGVDRLATVDRAALLAAGGASQDLSAILGQVGADVGLVYTLATTYHDVKSALPLESISLSGASGRPIFIRVAASAVLVDAHTGAALGRFDASVQSQVPPSAWADRTAADRTRRQAESEAFRRLVDRVRAGWPVIWSQGTGSGGS
jgi:hypothetical protein